MGYQGQKYDRNSIKKLYYAAEKKSIDFLKTKSFLVFAVKKHQEINFFARQQREKSV